MGNNNVVEAYKLEEGMEIFLLGHAAIVEAVTAFGPDNVIIHTTLGAVPVPSARWIKVLS